MKETTLANIKADLSKFHKVVERIAKYWNEPHMITISVLLQNAAFSGVGSFGYSHEKAVNKVRETQGIIRDISNYLGEIHHFEKWIAQEVEMIIDGAYMLEDYEPCEGDYIPELEYPQ